MTTNSLLSVEEKENEIRKNISQLCKEPLFLDIINICDNNSTAAKDVVEQILFSMRYLFKENIECFVSEQNVYDCIQKVQQGNSSYLLHGASFAGKDKLLLAHLIQDKVDDSYFNDVELESIEYIADMFFKELNHKVNFDEEEMSKLSKIKERIKDDIWDFREVFELNNLFSIKMNIKTEKNLHCNLILKHGGEINNCFSTFSLFNNEENFSLPVLEKKSLDTALGWLIRQQGYSISDFINGVKSPFLNSLRKELENDTGSTSGVTLCVEFDLEDLIKFVDNTTKSVVVPQETMCGLVGFNNGDGGLMGIKLEKPVVLPHMGLGNLVHEIQIEDAKNYYYTVDEIFGLVNSCWNNRVSYTDEKPLVLLEPEIVEEKPIVVQTKTSSCKM